MGGGFRFDIQEKLIFPRATVDRAAFDLLQVNAVSCERLERGEERAGAVREAHGDGHLTRFKAWQLGFAGGTQQKKASEIFHIVLNAGYENDAAVVFRGAASGDGRGSFIAAGDHFAHASGGIFRGDALQTRMRNKKTLALGQGHGVGSDGAEIVERRAAAADEVMLDWQDGLRGDSEGAFEKKIVNADDRAGQSVFDRGQESIRETFVDGPKSGVKSGPRHGGDTFAEKLDSSFFAESAGLTLKRNAHFMDDSISRRGHGVLGFSTMSWLRREQS